MVLLPALILGVVAHVFARPDCLPSDDSCLHPIPKSGMKSIFVNEKEKTPDFWKMGALKALNRRVKEEKNENIAKNVIVFLGDGMSVPTITASRVHAKGETGELEFDKFPHTGISKVFCVDTQVADSACSATAYLGGVKSNIGTIGVTGAVDYSDCAAMQIDKNKVKSIAHYSQLKGKSTGFVTTTRVTHASPAGLYAHTANRDWESDTDIVDCTRKPAEPIDVAAQLVRGGTGKNFNVIMGGGRKKMLPSTTVDEENEKGARADGLNLIEEWKQQKKDQKKSASYVWNRKQLLAVDVNNTDYLMGLFESDHCKYNMERDKTLDPSLEEMTEVAIKMLRKNENGYFLFVEGGKIDIAHHFTYARMALDETIEFSKAIGKAVNMTNEEDTLIVVTADHAHTLSYSGYASRGNDILGFDSMGTDNLKFTTLNYANGPGYKVDKNGRRHDMSNDSLKDLHYQYPSAVPLSSETHGGDDVAIYAKGPYAHLFTGVMDQTVIPHILAYASCVGDNATACDGKNSGSTPEFNLLVSALLASAVYCINAIFSR